MVHNYLLVTFYLSFEYITKYLIIFILLILILLVTQEEHTPSYHTNRLYNSSNFWIYQYALHEFFLSNGFNEDIYVYPITQHIIPFLFLQVMWRHKRQVFYHLRYDCLDTKYLNGSLVFLILFAITMISYKIYLLYVFEYLYILMDYDLVQNHLTKVIQSYSNVCI